MGGYVPRVKTNLKEKGKREMSKRFVDADEFAKTYMQNGEYKFTVVRNDEIEITPTADAVEVIRCKDCAYGIYNEATGRFKCDRRYEYEDVSALDYCSRGERRCEG